MRIYNGKKTQLDLPLGGTTRILVQPFSVSKDFLPSDYFLLMMAQCFTKDDLAIIISGPTEINLCAKNPACSEMVVQSLEEAISRFNSPEEDKPKTYENVSLDRDKAIKEASEAPVTVEETKTAEEEKVEESESPVEMESEVEVKPETPKHNSKKTGKGGRK